MLTKQAHMMVTLKMVMVTTPLKQLDELDELDDWMNWIFAQVQDVTLNKDEFCLVLIKLCQSIRIFATQYSSEYVKSFWAAFRV